MSTNYKDYGYFGNGTAPQVPDIIDKKTQVFLATHEGDDIRLPFMNRSFISFTYGGEYIEDFGLIVITDNNRISRKLYSDFSDNTTNYEALDGQFYWGSYFTKNSLELTLATDGIREDQLAKFKYHFSPGPPKELILAEAPNRAIMARISDPPEMHLLPFETRITRTFGGVEKTLSTTLYKGSITLKFVMDDPLWYSLRNVLPAFYYDFKNHWVHSLSDNDMLKIISEDNVPTQDMLNVSLDTFITGNERHVSAGPLATPTSKSPKAIAGGRNSQGQLIVGSRLAITAINLDPSVAGSSTAYLYYAGTSKAPTILHFELVPAFGSQNGLNYITFPKNEIANTVMNLTDVPYNTISVGSQVFKYTAPKLFTSYNTAMQILTDLPNNTSLVDIKRLLNERIKDAYVHNWAQLVINYLMNDDANGVNHETKIISNINVFRPKVVENMRYLFESENITKCQFDFNSKTGVATGTFKIRVIPDPSVDIPDLTSIAFSNITENVGDMVYDKYLFLSDRNYINETTGMVTNDECTKIVSDGEISNLNIQYKHMYL